MKLYIVDCCPSLKFEFFSNIMTENNISIEMLCDILCTPVYYP